MRREDAEAFLPSIFQRGELRLADGLEFIDEHAAQVALPLPLFEHSS
jgi:hypothetical protein